MLPKYQGNYFSKNEHPGEIVVVNLTYYLIVVKKYWLNIKFGAIMKKHMCTMHIDTMIAYFLAIVTTNIWLIYRDYSGQQNVMHSITMQASQISISIVFEGRN